MRRFVATANDEDVRLSRFVQRVTQNLSEPNLYKSFRKRRIKRNGKRAQPQDRLAQGDVIELYLNDEFFAKPNHEPPANNKVLAYNKPNIVWQNKELAILYKPQGLLSHSSTSSTPSLLANFTHYLVEQNEYQPNEENTFTPALCNRLDRNTEGLVIAAKTYTALRSMNELIRTGLVGKTYLCITVGKPPEGTHQAFLVRDSLSKTTTVSNTKTAGAKPITTGIKVQQNHQGFCLCEVQLFTGRTHQIRAHLAYLGAPLLGDKKYGGNIPLSSISLPGQALCAWQLSFSSKIPAANHLAYLNGKTFTAKQAHLPTLWHRIVQNKSE